jgi:hypothetical protein
MEDIFSEEHSTDMIEFLGVHPIACFAKIPDRMLAYGGRVKNKDDTDWESQAFPETRENVSCGLRYADYCVTSTR